MKEPHPGCSGALSAHVVFDKPAGGYRAQVRCPCGLTARVAKTLHAGFYDALVESRATPLHATTRRAKPPPKPRERGEAGRPRITPRRIQQPAPITPAMVDAAWLAYWKQICARVGHQSRL